MKKKKTYHTYQWIQKDFVVFICDGWNLLGLKKKTNKKKQCVDMFSLHLWMMGLSWWWQTGCILLINTLEIPANHIKHKMCNIRAVYNMTVQRSVYKIVCTKTNVATTHEPCAFLRHMAWSFALYPWAHYASIYKQVLQKQMS